MGLKPHESACGSSEQCAQAPCAMRGDALGSRVCRQGTTLCQINWYSWPVGQSCNLFFCRISQLGSEEAAVNVAIGNAKSRSICWTGAASWMGAGEHFATSPVLHTSCWAITFMLAPFICSQIRHPALQNCWASRNFYSSHWELWDKWSGKSSDMSLYLK